MTRIGSMGSEIGVYATDRQGASTYVCLLACESSISEEIVGTMVDAAHEVGSYENRR